MWFCRSEALWLIFSFTSLLIAVSYKAITHDAFMHLLAIPLRKSFDADPLLYVCPEKYVESISRGCLVVVPWRDGEQEAVVFSILDEAPEVPYEVRDILRVLTSTSVLHEYELHDIITLTQKYLLRIHLVGQLFLPATILNTYARQNYVSCEKSNLRE